MNRISITHLAAAILWVGLLTTAGANASPPIIHNGSCEVDQNGKLNGSCLAICPPYYVCCSGSSSECPAGRRAKKINYVPCEGAPVRVDPKKVCHF